MGYRLLNPVKTYHKLLFASRREVSILNLFLKKVDKSLHIVKAAFVLAALYLPDPCRQEIQYTVQHLRDLALLFVDMFIAFFYSTGQKRT